ncbi:MAG: hypothetical protein JNM68_16990 [Dinghuibacter sp.]|nr:hypothetical protein [Dinghuibacter sp.]
MYNGQALLASLPSSQNHLPATQEINHGCLEIPDIGINCYIFTAQKPIATNGWFFERNTFLYGFWLEDFEIAVLEKNYSIPGVDYEIIGDLTPEELRNVIHCFTNSSVVKRKYKRILME